MRMLIVVHQYPPEQVGGTEVYTQALARALANRGHQVVVFRGGRPPGGPAESLDGPVRIVFAPSPTSGNSLALFLADFAHRAAERPFAALLGQFDPHVAHFQHLKGLSTQLVTLARRRGVPVAFSVHDYWTFCGNAQLIRPDGALCDGPRWWLNCVDCAAARIEQPALKLAAPGVAALFAWRDRAIRRALANVDRFLAPSDWVRDQMERQGYPAERFTVLSHGTEPPPEPLQRRPSPDGRLRALYVGGLAWQKGVHVLVEAVNGLQDAPLTLKVHGPSDPFPQYVAALRNRCHNPNVVFAGPLERAGLWSALAASDVLVVPSLWAETYALVVSEAFAAGVPVVASRVGALAERVHHGVDGLLFPMGDVEALRAALQRLVEEPGLLDRLQQGIRPVKTMETHAAELEALYGGGQVPPDA